MKHLYLTALVLLTLGFSADAQLRMALIGGGHAASVIETNSIPNWESTTKPGYSSRSGMHLGVLIEVPFTPSGKWFFQPGLLYQAKGRKFFMRNDTAAAIATDTISSAHNVGINYIELPLNLTYKAPLSKKVNFVLSAGPYVGFFYNGKQKIETRIYSSNNFKDNDKNLESGNEPGKIKTIDLGVNARAGFEIGNVWISGFASRGLTDFYTADYDGSFRHQVVGASLAIWLNKTKHTPKQPKDTDKDGIPDLMDECPAIAGVASAKGCPDQDGDGVADAADKCPQVAGTAKYKGCPIPDADSDGIDDESDKCPAVAGAAKYGGCPPPDTDGDGINDEADSCPDKAGTPEFNGCPVPDSDGDGLNDQLDKCPLEAGTTQNNGCPEIKKEIVEKVNFAARNIFFNKNSDQLQKSSYQALDEIAQLLNANPSFKLSIAGHTDAKGSAELNDQLSQKRAESVLRYISTKGITASRLSAKGYGSVKPVDTNDTEKGRARNRRVELKLEQY